MTRAKLRLVESATKPDIRIPDRRDHRRYHRYGHAIDWKRYPHEQVALMVRAEIMENVG